MCEDQSLRIEKMNIRERGKRIINHIPNPVETETRKHSRELLAQNEPKLGANQPPVDERVSPNWNEKDPFKTAQGPAGRKTKIEW